MRNNYTPIVTNRFRMCKSCVTLMWRSRYDVWNRYGSPCGGVLKSTEWLRTQPVLRTRQRSWSRAYLVEPI